jgi:hypothetical protein
MDRSENVEDNAGRRLVHELQCRAETHAKSQELPVREGSAADAWEIVSELHDAIIFAHNVVTRSGLAGCGTGHT